MTRPVSAIIVTFNRVQDLLRTLAHITEDARDICEIIVVDNASTDGTPDEVRHQFPNVRLVRLHENTGVCFARNVGAANASGDFYLFLDDDCFLDFDALPRALRCLQDDGSTAVIGFNVIELSLESALSVYKAQSYALYARPGVHEATTFPGGACIVRAEQFHAVGGYDDRLFYLGEETEIGIRMFKKGYRILLADDIIYLHYASGAARPSNRRTFYYYRNRLLVAGRHFPLLMFFGEAIGIAIAGFMRTLRGGQFLTYLKGLAHGVGLVLVSIGKRTPLSWREALTYYRLANRDSLWSRFLNARM